MKKLVLFASLFALVSCSSNEVEVGNKTTLEVEAVFDAGKVIKGEKVKAVFVIKNTGSYQLVIADAKPSCSCTVPSKPEAPIMPGESGKITAVIDTEKVSSGPITKNVVVVANTTPSETRLTIKANVIAK